MGGIVSVSNKAPQNPKWKHLVDNQTARLNYAMEGVLPYNFTESQLEFRVLLSDEQGISYLEKFAATHMYDKKQKNQLVQWKRLIMQLQTEQQPGCDVRADAWICFEWLYSNMFFQFKKSAVYMEMCAAIKNINCVDANDFDFFTQLGVGSFGCVFSCCKRSTGAMYAMKVQTKSALLHNARGNLDDVMMELHASIGIPSPFICQAHYAFQTSKLVCLALPLYSGGDLRHALKACPNGHFSVARAQCYAAELAAAVMFLHDNGLIHRDLKPENVFIEGNGHLVVGDLGSVADEFDRLLLTGPPAMPTSTRIPKSSMEDTSPGPSNYSNANSFQPYSYLSRQNSACSSVSGIECSYAFESRGEGLVGTMRYMAPEIMVLFAPKVDRDRVQGCTPAADWFSYGVIVHEMLTGACPYNPPRGMTYRKLGRVYPNYFRKTNYNIENSYKLVMGSFDLPKNSIDSVGLDFVSNLVALNPINRLGLNKLVGVSTEMYSDIKSHAFFAGTKWDDVMNRSNVPVLPESGIPVETEFHAGVAPTTMSTMLRVELKFAWLDDDDDELGTSEFTTPSMHRDASRYLVTDCQQSFFDNWHFASPAAIEAEIKYEVSRTTDAPGSFSYKNIDLRML